MNIVHLSTSDLDGGAARAAYRLHQGLNRLGATSQMLVRAKDSIDDQVISDASWQTRLGPVMNGFPLKRYANRDRALFSPQWFPDAIAPRLNVLNPDIVHLHWICNGFVQIETLPRLHKPMVWTLHDMWVFTGGCHYNKDCFQYKENCGYCPQLNSQREQDLSRRIWQRKAKAWKDLNLTLITPSHWFADCVRSSSLFRNRRVEVIPHGLDLSQYQPVPKTSARDILKLPQDKQLVLFGASSGTMNDPRKGFQFLVPALKDLASTDWHGKLELVIFGANQPSTPLDLGFPVHYLGRFHDDITLAIAYSAVDVMIVPSMQESFGQTASEALACGTPVVAFNATGVKDIVSHQQDGYLAQPFEYQDLAQGIVWVLEDGDRGVSPSENRHHKLSHHAREKAIQEFSQDLQAKRHIALYEDILS
ncbi:glycosyltransferase family 4 protein [Lyngbya confervoides]|uniref:Glycosyltransferase family 4 protein n=1 Tax=Lyngbya confervoides BDU141951 TaxID=1574623 RepID=A0ABD4T7Z0_9CYAN|nr:glycosyltransferase family 4 protein [Lyngbya confervoides]MCM1984902.1 glycosyltransferase family 4 protein [Lyngbya confervoides BDU141951]